VQQRLEIVLNAYEAGGRGGARVIYFYHNVDRPLYLLMVYAKARQESLAAEEKQVVRKLTAILKG
jgi:hypothetical protein